MPKLDLNSALNKNVNSEERRKKAAEATSFMTSAFDMLSMDQSRLNIKSVPIEKIRPREINEFEQTGIETLIESIRLFGLINPLSVVYHADEDVYIISSGHRRFQALSYLHKENPKSEEYANVDCAVYEITTDTFKLAQGLPYISPEQEEGIYRDSNIENRQLSYSDVAHQIRYILNRFDDPEYIKKIRKHAADMGIPTRDADFNKTKLIMSVLSQSHFQGWKQETIRQYLKVKEAGREDLLDAIENQNMAVSAAYKLVVKENNQSRRRKTNKIKAIKNSTDELLKEASKRDYDEKELKELEEVVRKLTDLINEKRASE